MTALSYPEHPPLALPSSLDPQQEQRRLFALLLHFFTEQATRQPLLFILEDLHWSDETSLELLLYLARNCTHLPILFVLTYRSDEVSPELRHCLAEFDREHLAQDFSLQRLARTEVDAMLQAIFAMHQATPTGLLESMYALTEGKPFLHRGGTEIAARERRDHGQRGRLGAHLAVSERIRATRLFRAACRMPSTNAQSS